MQVGDLAAWRSGDLPKHGLGDVLLLRSYFGEVSYLNVIARLCHVTMLLCYVRDHTTLGPPSLVLTLVGTRLSSDLSRLLT